MSLLLALLGTALAGGDSFTNKYAYSKVMGNCFGEDYHSVYEKELHKHSYECKMEIYAKMKEGKEPEVQINKAPFAAFFETLRSSSAGQPQYIPIPAYYQSSQVVNPFLVFQRQKRETIYSSELLKKTVETVKNRVETLMCVAKKMQLLDENKDVNIAIMKHQEIIGGLDPALQQDLIRVVDKCYAFSKCVEDKDSPLPIELQRILSFFKCSKKGKVSACMKADLRKQMDEFDLSGLPEYEGEEDEKVEKLLHVLWGADPSTDPLNLLA